MRLLKDEELPFPSKEFRFELSEEVISLFHRAFRWNTSTIPPTLAARAFGGMFEVLNLLEVDWKKLLHTTQSFEYFAPLSVGMELSAQTYLMKWRKRSGIHWLQFDSLLKEAKSGTEILKAQSLILIEDSQ